MPRKYPISRSKDHQFTVNDLITMRCDLAGERENLLKQSDQIGMQIEHLDAALQMFGFNDFGALTPIRRLKPVKIGRIEARSRRAAIWAFVSQATNGCTTTEIVHHLIDKFALDQECQHEGHATRNYIRKVLNRWQAQGGVELCDYSGQCKTWRVTG
jgi:hypothetical protein